MDPYQSRETASRRHSCPGLRRQSARTRHLHQRWFLLCADLSRRPLKFASGDKLKGTSDEYKEASLSTSVHFGRYTIDPAKATITFHIDRSSFPNQDDTAQVRPFEMTGDELSWKVAPRPDGSIPITVLRRVGGKEMGGAKGLN